jgi:hypothetical protein
VEAEVSKKFEILTRRVIWSRPSPAPWDMVEKDVREAREEYKRLTGESWDNVPHISAHDDEIHVWFDIEVKDGKTS